METKDKLKSIGAVLAVFAALVLLLCVFATIDSSALEVPRYQSNTNELSGKYALDTTDANTLVNYVIALDRLGYLDTRNFLILARPKDGSTTRLYVSSTAGGNVVVGSNSTLSISNFNVVEFYGSNRYYGSVQVSAMSFPIENVLCYKIGDNIVNNVSNGTYVTGTGKVSHAFSTYMIEFTNYANTILGWNGEDYQSGYDAGYTAGQQVGYGTGYTVGYNAGYEQGLADGGAGGGGYTEEDLNEARQEGYDIGKSEGYDIGYLDGTDYGYEQGYNQAVRDATPNEIDIERVITAIPESVRTIFDETFGFELFGINVAGTLLTILVVAIVAFVVRKLLDSR